MRVLVTGASGMLGRCVAEHLRSAGHSVRTFQRRPSGLDPCDEVLGSLTRVRDVERAVDGVVAVVHLAAKVSLAGDPADFRRVNVDGTRTLIDVTRRAGARTFVHVSSPSVAHVGTSLVGAEAEPADPAGARGSYARTKAEAEVIALAADDHALRVVAVRPHLVWGPGDTQLVSRLAARARAGRLPLLGDGAALIDTTYVDNAASGIAAALHRADAVHGNAYVVTNGEPRPVAEMLTALCAAMGAPGPRGRVSPRLARAAGGVIESVWGLLGREEQPPMTRFLAEQLSTAHWFDQRRTRAELRWSPSVTIDEGLARLATHPNAVPTV